jgi:excinuclease UvrABC ATPase subunit
MILATGTPEEVAENPRSYTGEALRRIVRPLVMAAD